MESKKQTGLEFMRLFAWCEKMDHRAYNFFADQYDRT